MKILITAGGTSEKIDDVRSITNHSTGRLGKAIAERFAKSGATIDYVTTQQAVLPQAEAITFHMIESTADLAHTITDLLTKNNYTAVIHSMAVSDFTPESSVTLAELEQVTAQQPADLAQALAAQAKRRTEKKISSDTDHLVLILKKNPKIIALIKELQPTTILVGFKLLVDVPLVKLLDVAHQSLVKNQADFILANDLAQISGEHHPGFLINRDNQVKKAQTKTEIADLIAQEVLALEEKQ